MKKIDWELWKPRLAYGGFALVAFLLSLRWTFPSEAVKERLIMEAGSRGWQIDLDHVSAGGLLGLHAEGVKLENASGLAIPIDELTASLRIFPLLVGRRSVAFDARLYDGRIRGFADLSGDPRSYEAVVSDVDLGRALPLRKASGLDLVGKASGTALVSVPDRPDGKPAGRIELTVKEAGLNGGQLPLPGMSTGLSLPKLALGTVAAAVKLEGPKGTFDRLEATGGDAEVRTEGVSFVVQPRMEFAPLFGKARVKVQDAFWTKSGTQGFKGLAEMALAQAKGTDGSWNFQVTGSVGHPKVQPAAGGGR